MRSWKRGDALTQWDPPPDANQSPQEADGNWYVTSQGHTMVRISAGSFVMGSPGFEAGRKDDELPHRVVIARDFRMSATPITREQWLAFLCDEEDREAGITDPVMRRRLLAFHNSTEIRRVCPRDDSPAIGVTWYLAAQYCNWLSRREGHTPCYEPDSTLGHFDEGMRPKMNYLALSGYRLPTEAEWEYACRAGTRTSRYFGEDGELLDSYAWFQANSDNSTQPVATCMPNPFGLFDMLGNVWQWCGDRDRPYDADASGKPDLAAVYNTRTRVLRGGSFKCSEKRVRAGCRHSVLPHAVNAEVGFRIVQTITIESATNSNEAVHR